MATPRSPPRSSALPAIGAVVLFSLFPVLNLLSSNAGQVQLLSAGRSAIVVVAGSLLALAGARLALRDWPRAALLVIGALLLFFSYGHVYDLVRQVEISGVVLGRHRYLMPLWMGAGLVWVWVVRAGGVTCLDQMGPCAWCFDAGHPRLVPGRVGDADDAGRATGCDDGPRRDWDGLRRGIARHLLHHPGRLRPVGCPRGSLRDRQHGFLALPGTARLLRGRRRQEQLLQDHPISRHPP